jgi:uncharacterized protein involved in exopolysaccharide biosynthesis
MGKIYTFLLALLMLMASAVAAFGQQKAQPEGSIETINSIKGSPAYAEVLLRQTELQADLESFVADYTEENPKVVDARLEFRLLTKAMDRLFAVRPSELSKLSLALGRLLVREAELEVELARQMRKYAADQSEVKRLKRKVEIYSASIKEILG